MPKLPQVSIIIVNWNGGKIFKNCLKSLEKLLYPNWELIIVDNGSNDNSELLYKEVHLNAKRVKLLKNKTNLGFAEANNQGYKVSKGEFVLLLNNDTKITPNFLNVLLKSFEKDKKLGVVQPKIKVMDKKDRLDNSGTFLTKTGFLEHWGYMEKDGKEFNKEKYIFSAKGACMLTKREVIDKVGLFDKDFGSYFEESDFCWRAWLAGWKVKYIPNTYIYHKVGFTSKKMSQIDVNYVSLKNRICSFCKNLDQKNLFLILGTHIIIIIGLGVYYLIKLEFSKSSMVFRALSWNITNIDKTRKKRYKVQKLRTKKDDEIFKYFMHKVDWSKQFSHFRKVEANFK